jgi:ubiquitin-protein ligase
MDPIFERFLRESWHNAKSLADGSDVVELVPFGDPPHAVVAQFHANCYVKTPQGTALHFGFTVGYRFPENYLNLALPWEVMHFLAPATVWHPNIRVNAICLGTGLQPGTELRELLFRTYELVTFQRRSQPADPLNAEAAAWVRRNWPVQPADSRPLKWRATNSVESLGSAR